MRALLPALCAMLLLGPEPVRAVGLYKSEETSVELGGDLTGWLVGVWPPDMPPVENDASGRGLLAARLKLEGRVGNWLSWMVHPEVTGSTQDLASLSLTPLAGTPEAVDLSRRFRSGSRFALDTRVDRASVRLRLSRFELTVGRQPVSFGSTFFFTPMDLVAPFTPVALDRRYKPGIDALRLDAFFGTSGRFTAVAAYAGSWDAKGLILLARARTTFGTVDAGAFAGAAHEDVVVGLDSASELAGAGIRGEVTFTKPAEGKAFVRAVLGADRRIGDSLMLQGEVYVQSIGTSKPEEYLTLASTERFARGELWAVGRYYAALAASYELLPIFELSLAVIGNLEDPSCLLAPGLKWSIAEELELVAGGYVGLGKGPELIVNEVAPEGIPVPRSEFGLAPGMGYVGVKAFL